MISLMYAGNDKMFDGILISLMSAVKHTLRPLSVFILTMDLSDTDPRFKPLSESHRRFLEEICRSVNPESKVSVVDVGDLYRETLMGSSNAKTGYTPYSFLRLFADRIEEIPSKVLYLDADTIINGDLANLFDTDISGYEYAAVLDYYGRWFMGYHYINSGVMLLNMDEIRRTGLFVRAVELCAGRRLFLPDQTALHRLTSKKLLLPQKYNEQKDYNNPDTVIQHFTKTIIWLPYFHTRTIKPWQPEPVREVLTDRYDKIISEYLEKKKEFNENEYEYTK